MARSTEKKQAILNAAISEFKNNGFANTSMDQIAMAAAVSKRTVYNHFASKDILFEAILNQMLTLFSAAVCVKYQQGTPIVEQLTQIAEQEVVLLSDPAFVDLARVIMAEMMHTPERINSAMKQVESRDGDLISWLNAAVCDGVLNISDTSFAATQFYSLIKAFCFWPQVVQGQAFPDKKQQSMIIDSAVTMFIGAYKV
ncbi:TetR/AcrR family transcriptional regulator [Thalassotalea sp. PLHSN55]|uniref:TetR/AcrR family transcriptional regulator n=1 Tax=Thalassotalea sp. PLHSN55 TaxID=3435888 RepID=UPI003F8730A6